MFKKNDPLVGAVQKIMAENAVRYQVEQKLCEELGVYSKNALPNEHKANFDALLVQRINEALKGDQHKIDANKNNKIDAHDFKLLRTKKKEPQGADYADAKRKARMADTGRMDEAEEGDETREGGAVTKDGKAVVSPTAMKAEPEAKGPSASDRSALTDKIKSIMKEAKEKMEMKEKVELDEADSYSIRNTKTDTDRIYHISKYPITTNHKIYKKIKAKDPEAQIHKNGQPVKEKMEMKEKVELDEADSYSIRNTKTDTDRIYHISKYPITTNHKIYKKIKAKDPEAQIHKNGQPVKEKMEMDEAAKSKSQQRLFGAALATRRGESEPGSRKIAKLAADVSEPELKKFAGTKLKGLPEKKKVSEEISFNSVMEEIAKKLGKSKMKEIEEEEDPNKPYQDKPLSFGDTLDARQTADKMQSTPGGAAPVPAAKPMPAPAAAPSLLSRAASAIGVGGSKPPAPTPAAAPASDNRSGLQKFFGMKATGRNAPAGPANVRQGLEKSVGKTPTTGPQAGVVPTSIEKEKTMAPNKAPATAMAPANIASQQRLAPVKPTEQEPGFSGEAGKKIQAAGAANDTTPEPGYSGEAGKTLEKATAAPKPAAAAPQTFGQAFAAARKAAGGAGGSFKYTDPKTGKTSTFQTNIKGEKYQPARKLKPVGMRESLQSTINNVLKG